MHPSGVTRQNGAPLDLIRGLPFKPATSQCVMPLTGMAPESRSRSQRGNNILLGYRLGSVYSNCCLAKRSRALLGSNPMRDSQVRAEMPWGLHAVWSPSFLRSFLSGHALKTLSGNRSRNWDWFSGGGRNGSFDLFLPKRAGFEHAPHHPGQVMRGRHQRDFLAVWVSALDPQKVGGDGRRPPDRASVRGPGRIGGPSLLPARSAAAAPW